MIYLVLGDAFSGIISSQVVDVCKYFRTNFNYEIKIVAFVSIRTYFEEYRKFKDAYADTLILPMFPRIENWKLNYWLLLVVILITGQKKILARGTLANNLSLKLKSKGKINWVGFDGRGAYKAEWSEYEVVNELMKKNVHVWEKNSVLESDFRLAVSKQLTHYWAREYGYNYSNHIVVPCTINSYFERSIPNDLDRALLRHKYGFISSDIILVYSGSTAEWQSFKKLDELLCKVMERNEGIKILFMSKIDLVKYECYKHFKERVSKIWVNHEEVFDILSMCDYGILYRENTETNQVAAPTKFGEYLAAGLQILISENLGDYSNLVWRKKLGIVCTNNINLGFKMRVSSFLDRDRSNKIAIQSLTKDAFKEEYHVLLLSAENKN